MARFAARRSVLASTLVTSTALLVYACTAVDENPGTPRKEGGGATMDANTASEGGGTTAATCAKVGGPSAVTAIANGILGRVRADCRLSAMFGDDEEGNQHLRDCFAIQLQVFFACPGVSYPGKDSEGEDCRSLTEAHEDLGLTGADFTAFVDDAQAELATHGLTPDELRGIASGFVGTRTAIVAEESPYNVNCSCTDKKFEGKLCSDPDAGNERDAADAADARDAAVDG